MAKAEFPCADCGTSVRVSGRNRSDADRLAAWRKSQGHVCGDCSAKHRAEDNSRAAALNQSAGLPPLTGSEKQVSWAETIRRETLARIEKAMPFLEDENAAKSIALAHPAESMMVGHHVSLLMRLADGPIGINAVHAFVRVMRRQTSARWWIDTRGSVYIEMARTLQDEIRAEIMPPAPPSEAQQAAEAEALLKPAGDQVSQLVAEIRHVAPFLRVSFDERNEPFRLTMHALGFTWATRYWQRQIDFRAGDPVDRMAEIAHRLLAIGFMVRVHDEDARAKAISGEFVPEQTRWVCCAKGGAYDGWLKIIWPRSDDLYRVARSLPGSRYKDGAVFVPPGSIEAVDEFAERYGFAMSDTPQRMLAEHRESLAHGVVVTDLKKAPEALRVEYSGKPKKLNAPTANIDNELKDE